MRGKLCYLAIMAMVVIGLMSPSVAAEDTEAPMVIGLTPAAGNTTANATPAILVEFLDPSGLDVDRSSIVVDDIDVSDWDESTTFTDSHVEYVVPEIFALDRGNHTVNVTLVDNAGNEHFESWNFTYDPSYSPGGGEGALIDFQLVVIIMAIAFISLGLGLLGYYIYLRRKKRFTFRRYFAKHPMQKKYLVVYIPMVLAVVFLILAFSYISQNSTVEHAVEYVIIATFFIGFGPYGIDTQMERKRRNQHERAFSQFLFELADAMRGGIEPTKAILELSKTHTGVIAKDLRVAADGIKIGRPFHDVLSSMVAPMNSDLITRYASLIGEASNVGGQISTIIYRAAKDMDDSIKIEAERTRQLMSQATTIYIAFGILLAIIYQLISIYPSLSSVDMSMMSSGLQDPGEASAGSPEAMKMGFDTLKERFFHLALVNSGGAGLLIGLFTNGKMKFGLMHAFVMIAVTVVFFVLMIF